MKSHLTRSSDVVHRHFGAKRVLSLFLLTLWMLLVLSGLTVGAEAAPAEEEALPAGEAYYTVECYRYLPFSDEATLSDSDIIRCHAKLGSLVQDQPAIDGWYVTEDDDEIPAGIVVGDDELILRIYYKPNFFGTVAYFNDKLNTFVWVKLGLIMLLGTGILMTILTKVFQISHIGHWMKHTIGSLFSKKVAAHTGEKASISQFQALCTALAATVGVGNIAGVAAAIVCGGPGAIFWMWVAAFFGMMTNYSENVLGIFFRRKVDGEWAGGAMYYLQDGLGGYRHCKWIGKALAVVFSCFCVLASFGIGNMGQVNKIVTNIESAFKIPALSNHVLYGNVTLYAVVIAAVLMIIGALIILGGLQRIASVAEKVVPVMVVLFILGSLVIIGVNYSQIGAAFKSIFSGAFTEKAAWGGAAGVSLKLVVTWGFKRGVFSNEAGLGSSVMVHSNSNVKEPVRQGLWGIFEVFADTIVICSMTALVILTSGVVDLETGVLAAGTDGDATLVAAAFRTVFGGFGDKFVAIALFLFAFTTVLGWSHYGSKAMEYLGGKTAKTIYKIIFVLMICSGALMTSSLAWDLSDTFNGLMMVPNLIGVVALSGLVMKITKNYVERNIRHKTDIVPLLSFDPDTQRMQAKRLQDEGDDD